tara:strand:+ start:24419 stop:25186 length:768 start_codon:yes stop_codon:yes gene_type:complete
MSDSITQIKGDNCLNCGETVLGNYCSNCGQKFQPTKLPLKLFLEDAVETLFNIDNRWFKTLKDLFLKPGKVTREYIEGKRAQYLPPLRIYLSISIVYFLLVQWSESDQIFFINFSDDENSIGDLGTIIQYMVFFMVPFFALFTKLFYRKRKAYYVEYLILSFHIHTVWFVLLMIELFTIWLEASFEQSWVEILAIIISAPAQLATFIYIVFYLKRTFEQGWLISSAKTMGIMILYMIVLVLLIAAYTLIFTEFFK